MISDAILFIARALVASVFLVSSIEKLKGSPQEMKAIQGLHIPAPGFMERLAGGCEVLGAIGLVFGIEARATAILLSVFMIFITAAFLRFWSFKGPPEALQGQKTAFFSNLSTVGALLYLAVVGPGSIAILPST